MDSDDNKNYELNILLLDNEKIYKIYLIIKHV